MKNRTLFYRTNRAIKVIAMAIGIALATSLAGCQAPQPPGPSLQNGYQVYESHNYSEAQTAAQQYIQSHPQGPNLDEAYYLAAISEEAQGNIPGARTDYRRAIAQSHRPDLLSKSYKALGDMTYTHGHYKRAISDYRRSLRANPAARPASGLLFRLGVSLQNMGQWQKGGIYLSRLQTLYPNTAPARAATPRLSQNHFTLQFGAWAIPAAAWRQVAALQQGGVAARVVPASIGGRTLYLVQSGVYTTYAAALAARSTLAGKFPQMIITP